MQHKVESNLSQGRKSLKQGREESKFHTPVTRSVFPDCSPLVAEFWSSILRCIGKGQNICSNRLGLAVTSENTCRGFKAYDTPANVLFE